MTEVLLFHHAQGLTPGVLAFADVLRSAGHIVHTPDLYDGNTFDNLADGIAYAQKVGFGTIQERGTRAADTLPEQLVYIGFSLGVVPAQSLAQSRPGTLGAIFIHAAILPMEFDSPWPAGVPMQVHTAVDDDEGDAEVAQQIADTTPEATVFLYPGSDHLFTDASLPVFNAENTAAVRDRVLDFLKQVDEA